MDIYDPKYKKISVGVLISLIFAFTFIAFLIIAAKNKKTGNINPTTNNQEEEKNSSAAEKVNQALSGESENGSTKNQKSAPGDITTPVTTASDVEKILNGGGVPSESKKDKISKPLTANDVENILK